MPPVVNDPVAWTVGLSPSEPCRKFWSDRDTVCVEDSGWPRERPITYSSPLRANTVLCSFNTIQPSSLAINTCYEIIFMNECYDVTYFWLFVEYFVLKWLVQPRGMVFKFNFLLIFSVVTQNDKDTHCTSDARRFMALNFIHTVTSDRCFEAITLSSSFFMALYTVSQKTIHLTFDHNFGRCNRFSKFFHWQISKEVLYVTIVGSSTSH